MRFSLMILLFLSACTLFPPREPVATYTPVPFSALSGWAQDQRLEAKPALAASCARLEAIPADRSLGVEGRMGTAGDWLDFCAALKRVTTEEDLRTLMERDLQPYAVSASGDTEGLFTGYYEADLRGSLTRHGPYQHPLYARPDDLVMVDLGEFRTELKGQRIAGSVVNGQLKPYADRAAIVSNGLTQAKPLVWLDDANDAFFVQIQGSGVVTLDSGEELRLGYAAQNGHPYVPIGKTLIAKGELVPGSISMQSIRAWLESNPEQAEAVRSSNPSYVFFTAQPDGSGPMGAANVPLTALRSLAVDNRFIGYHVPVWLETQDPRLNRLMVAQDTGGAIRGIVRGDVFWGRGPQAEQMAGTMRSKGRYFVLLPKALPAP